MSASRRLLLVGLFCGACSVESERAVHKYEGEHFTLETDLLEVCGGTLAMIDREIVRIDGDLGFESSNIAPAEIEIVPNDLLTTHCSRQAGACTRGNHIYVPPFRVARTLSHELVHQRSHFAGVQGSEQLFTEGLAVALSGIDCIQPDYEPVSLDALLEVEYATAVPPVYYLGGELLNWLLATYGPESVLAFVAESRVATPPEETRAAYLERFGSSLEDDLYAHVRAPSDYYSRAQTGCIAPELASLNGIRHLRADMACASNDVQNNFGFYEIGRSDVGLVEWTIAVESQESGYFELRGEIPESLHFQLSACVCGGAHPTDFRYLDPPPVFSHDFQQERRVLLGAGDYRIHWSAPLDEGLEVELEFAPVCSFETQNCPVGEQCTIWNSCEPEAAIVAGVGEACDQDADSPLVCEAGSRCVAGVCTPSCDADQPCPDGLVCGRSRTCGPSCSLASQDCVAGWSCVPTVDAELESIGLGHCQPAGTAQVLESCEMLGSSCDVGLSCERVDDIELIIACGNHQRTGCCTPLCDPAAADPGCPDELPTCLQRFDASQVGVCV